MIKELTRYDANDRNALEAFGLIVVSAKQRGHRPESDRSTSTG
jgi:hypothetical protein